MPGGLAARPADNIVLDGNSKGRVFDGLGAASAGASSRLLIDYPEPQRSQILDYLFKPGYGAALQHLKVEIGADVNSTDGSEPSHMRTAIGSRFNARLRVVADGGGAQAESQHHSVEILPWGAPGWVNPNPGAKTHSTRRRWPSMLRTSSRWRSAITVSNIAYTGVWNEKVLRRRLCQGTSPRSSRHDHLATKIVCCDEYPGEGDGQWAIADAILKDPELAADIAVIGVHYPQVNGKITTTDAARKTGKPLWSSEDQPNGGGGPFVSRDWPVGGRILAHLYNQNYLEGSLTATEIWSPITSYYDNLAAPNSGLMYANTPWSGHYDVQGTIWATAHTTQFAQPGWQYLDSASGYLPEKGSYVSLRSPDKKNWSVVLETIGAKHPQTVSFQPRRRSRRNGSPYLGDEQLPHV